MYHKVSLAQGDALTVTCGQLEAQLVWLKGQKITVVTATQVLAAIAGASPLPADSVLVTFDDAYLDTFKLAFPILRRLGIPAVVFVPSAFIGGTSEWDAAPQPLMDESQLRQLRAAGWEIGLHSHRHRNFERLASGEIAADLKTCAERLRPIAALGVLAYPYGRRPSKSGPRQRLHADLAALGVQAAFRIGNRINRLPLHAAYEINRLGVRGDRSLAVFRRQIWWGRWF